jgi:4-hydroxy-2-oxoheptanedioate aldolase
MATIRPNRVKQRLAAGETVVSLGGGLDNPDLIDLVGPLGLDAIWLEGEHGPVDYGRVGDLTRACDLWGMTSIVRVNALDYGNIYRMLDLGAQGICVPHIDTADHARAFVEAAKFAPIGKRGLFTSRQGYGVPDYLEVANDHTLLIALIEDIKAVENLDAILAVDHIDVYFVAPSDLAASMGLIGEPEHAEVQRVREATLKRIVAAGRTAGTTLVGNRNAEHYTALGVRFIAAFLQPWLAAGAASLLASIKTKG